MKSVLAAGLPKWVELLIIRSLKGTLTPEAVAEAFANGKAWVVAQLRALAQSTKNQLDDRIVDMVEQALTTCSDELQFLCDLIEKGEVALVEFCRDAAKKSETQIDDFAVDILAEALGVPTAAVGSPTAPKS